MGVLNQLTQSGLTAPADDHFAITPDDTNPLPQKARSIWIGVGGDITVRVNGVDLPYTVPDAYVLTVQATHVLATGTNAGQIRGWA